MTCFSLVQGAVGAKLIVSLLTKDASGAVAPLDLTDVTAVVFRLQKPSGVVADLVGDKVGPDDAGVVELVADATTLDEAGDYRFQVRLTLPSGVLITCTTTFVVEPSIPAPTP